MQTRREVLTGLTVAYTAGCSNIIGRNPSNIPDYEIPLYLENCHDRKHTIEITIRGERDEPYAELSRTLGPDSERKLQPFVALEDTGREQFTVVVSIDGSDPETAVAEMNRCYGPVFVKIRETGQRDITHGIC